jgi:hypothetical protein
MLEFALVRPVSIVVYVRVVASAWHPEIRQVEVSAHPTADAL